jgi:phosphatidylinositol 4-kinase
MAASLREQESVTDDEFEELRRVDYEYRQEHLMFEFDRMKAALEVLGNDMQSMLGFLSNPSGLSGTQNNTLDSINGSLKLYFLVVLRLVTLADMDPDLIDFYWPQIIHIHLLLSKSHQTPCGLGMVDLLQQGLLAIALKYPQLAVKLSWALLAAIGDYTGDKKITQTQYAACMCLLLQLEVHTYGVASCLTGIDNSAAMQSSDESNGGSDSPTSKGKSILMNILHPACHQKQELVIELYTLIRVRRRSHAVHKSEMEQAQRIVLAKHAKGEPLEDFSSSASLFHAEASSQGETEQCLRCVDLFLDTFNERHHHESCADDGSTSFTKITDAIGNNTTSDKSNNDEEDMTWIDSGGDRELSNSTAKNDSNVAAANFAQRVIWQGLSDQLDWVEQMTDLVDTLRFVDRPLRAEVLKRELNHLFCHPSTGELLSTFALDPASVAGEPMYRLKKIFVEETRVFRTKARAPSLLIFEVERSRDKVAEGMLLTVPSSEDGGPKHRGGSFDHVSSSDHNKNRSRTHTAELDENDIETNDVDVDQILQDKMQAAITTIHKVEQGLKSEVTNSTTITPQTHRSASDNDLAEGDAPPPPATLRSQSTTDLATSDSIPRSRRLSTTGNYNAITKVDFYDEETISVNHLPPDTVSRDIDDDDFIHVPRISDDVPEEEIAVSEKVINSAVRLFNSGLITKDEYLQLVDSNAKYRQEAKCGEEETFRAKLEGYFGLDWELKKVKLLGLDISETGGQVQSQSDSVASDSDDKAKGSGLHLNNKEWPERDLRCFIVKSNDDLRQEVACIQLIELCQEIFAECNLSDTLWLKPYRIVSTGPAAGFVETLPNTLSIDAIKKTDNFVSLPHFFQNLYGGSSARLLKAKKNFVKSLAAYSLVSYILSIKDRHNGNILIDQEGHVIHIDFGFLFGIAPGGNFSIESAPFKLTEEMLEVFGGIDSDMFSEYVKAFTQGFLALRSKSTAILSAVSLIANDSSFPCFQGKDVASILDKLRQRFKCEMSSADAIEHCLELIIQSYGSMGTRQYDSFQWYTNGIIP